jgi:hypothetical protein
MHFPPITYMHWFSPRSSKLAFIERLGSWHGPVVLYGYVTWFLGRIFRDKREGMLGGWTEVCNEEFHYLYFYRNYQIKEIQMGETCNTH